MIWNVPEIIAQLSQQVALDAGDIIIHLFRPEVREFYNIADVAINLTLHHDENFGLAQVEAMACGLPVVGSLWGGLKDTIRDGRQ